MTLIRKFRTLAAASMAFATLLACTMPEPSLQPQSGPQAPVQAPTTFVAINGLTAVSLPNGLVEIKGRAVRQKDEYWCAVGDYARRGLRVPWDTRIRVVRGIGAPASGGARSAVQFTLTPDPVADQPEQSNVITDILRPGYSRSVTHAYGNCRDMIFPHPFR